VQRKNRLNGFCGTRSWLTALKRGVNEIIFTPQNNYQPKEKIMDSMTIIAVASIATAGLTIAIGSVGPALGEGRAVATALSSLAQQPDAAATITRTLFVGLAMIESIAIYCFVVSMILIFANPFWNHVIAGATQAATK
jgi:F-type H+-transporting ATPase subunit c